MNLIELKRFLNKQGVTLALNGDGKLQYTSPKGIMTPVLTANIRWYSGALMDALSQVPQVPQAKPVQQQSAHRERAASQPLPIVKKNIVRENTSTKKPTE